MISRPSNSGIATCIAASIGRQRRVGLPPSARATWSGRAPGCTGTSSVGERTGVPRLVLAARHGVAAPVPPAASTVATRASARPSSSHQRRRRRRAAIRRTPAARCRPRPRSRRRACRRTRCSRTARARGRRPPRRSAGRVAARARRARRTSGSRCGRGEPLAGQEQRVGQEPVQLTQVVRAALAQVGERLGRPRPPAPSTAPSARRPARPRRRAAPPAGPTRRSASTPSGQARRPPSSRSTTHRHPVEQGGQSRGLDAGRVGRAVERARSCGRPAAPCRQWTTAGRGRRLHQRCAERPSLLLEGPRPLLGDVRRRRVSWLPDQREPSDLPASRQWSFGWTSAPR